MTQTLLIEQQSETKKTSLPDLKGASHIAIIINNEMNTDVAPGGGIHWSVLVVCVRHALALHYDSMPVHGNRPRAHDITRALGSVLDTQLEFIHMEDVPLQRNVVDCGLYACISMEFVIEKILHNAQAGEPDDEYSLSLRGWDINTKRGRRDLRLLMKILRNECPPTETEGTNETKETLKSS